jgi:NYN domain
MAESIFLFWDNSNIFIPAQYLANRHDGWYAERAIRIQFDNLYRLAVAGRSVGKAFCVGSIPPELKAVWDNIRRTGVQLEVFERGADTGKEQGVDQCLQVHLLRAGMDCRQPQIAVLLTGDGKGYEDGVGYHVDIKRLHQHGWGVEVLSWELSCNAKLRAWTEKNGVFVPLDKYYESITFVESGRKAKPISLTHRSWAKVGAAAHAA